MKNFVESMKKGLAGQTGQKLVRRLWILPAIATIWVLVSYNVRTFGLSGGVEKAIERYKTTEKDIVASLDKPSRMIEQMSKQNPFSGAAAVPSMPQCLGILGEFALFGDRWYKIGDTVQDAKIVSIGPSDVKILWQEKEQSLKPFDVEVQYEQRSQSGRPTTAVASQSNQAVAQRPSEMQQMPQMPMMMGGGRGGFNPFNMSPDEMSQMRDRFMNMSPDERRRAFEEMRGRR